MAKTKKNRKNMADKVRTSKSAKEKRLNPFELRINKQKHDVLGRTQNIRGQVGNPGQSRTKANKKRTKTLLVELKQAKKSNVFKDQRLGEKISSLSQEEKAMQRFALERKIQHQHKGRLAEDGEEEQLTHYGQSLAEIEKFDDIEPDSDSDEDGRLGGQVAEEHFGGFLTRKPESEKSNWKERMAELISQTRKKKYERQSEKDSVFKLTEELDAQFKELNHLLVSKKPAEEKAKEKPKADDYDIKVRSLHFEARAKPSDRLKTEEELAKEEAERLKKLEADRKRRMKGELIEHEAPTHISADSLDDGHSYGYTPSAQKNKVSFQHDKESDASDDEEEEKEDRKAEDSDNEDNKDSAGEEDDDDEDDDDDLESDEDEEEAEKLVEKLLKKKMEEKKSGPKSILKATVVDPEKKKKIVEDAQKEIPYTFEAPADLDGLVNLLSKYSEGDQVTVVERLVACHHPSLVEGNKQKLQLLFSLLLEYLLDAMAQDGPPVKLFDSLTPLLHQLMNHNPEACTGALTQLLLDRHDEFQQTCQRRGGRGRYMGLDTMLLLKLISVLYPTSDFKHPVVTPSFHFMAAMLGQTPVTNERDIAAGLYLCSLCLEYVLLSKRYIPEVINFMHGILFLASSKDAKKVERVFPPFKPVGNFSDLLRVKKKVKDITVLSVAKTLAADVEKQQVDTDEFRVSSISTCVQLLQEYSHLYSSLPAAAQIFAPIKDMLGKLPASQYPQGLQDCIQHLKATLEKDACQSLQALTMEKKKPQPLKMFEPRIEEVFDGRKKRKGTREQLERQRLQHKVKKETKGAMREIRKDSQFLARQQLKATMEKDADRNKKLKRLYADLAEQEGEVRAIKRQKERAKDRASK